MELTRKYDTYTWSENGKRILEYDLKTNVIIGKSGQELTRVPRYSNECSYFGNLNSYYVSKNCIELINRLISLNIYNVNLQHCSEATYEFCLKKKNWKVICSKLKQHSDNGYFDLTEMVDTINRERSEICTYFSENGIYIDRCVITNVFRLEQRIASLEVLKNVKRFIKQFVSDCLIAEELKVKYPRIQIYPKYNAYLILEICEGYTDICQRWSKIISLPPLKNYFDYNNWRSEVDKTINSIAETVYFDSLPSALAFENYDYIVHVPKNRAELEAVSEHFQNCAAHLEYNQYLKTGLRYLVWAENKTNNDLDICIDMNTSDLTIRQFLGKYNSSRVRTAIAGQRFYNEYQKYLNEIERN